MKDESAVVLNLCDDASSFCGEYVKYCAFYT